MIDMYILTTYATRVGTFLKNFKQKKPRLWEFSHSCEKSNGLKSLKKRAYIYETTDGKSLNVKCQHCGYSKSLGNFMREISPSLHDEFRIEAYRGNITKINTQATAIKEPKIDVNLNGLIPVTKLPVSSSVLKFLERRKIPKDKYKLLYVAKHFYQWAEQYNSTFKDSIDNSPRLVIPFFTREMEVIGFTARTFNPVVEPRYIHMRINKQEDFVFGKERLDYTKTIYVTEGQIDSLFLDNAIAVGGAHYNTDFIRSIKDRAVIIPDNDWRRNKQVGDQLKRTIMDGFKIAFMPITLKGKDLNDNVKNGVTLVELKDIIDANTKSGLEAQLEFSLLKKY
jgi:hypothetical protein